MEGGNLEHELVLRLLNSNISNFIQHILNTSGSKFVVNLPSWILGAVLRLLCPLSALLAFRQNQYFFLLHRSIRASRDINL